MTTTPTHPYGAPIARADYNAAVDRWREADAEWPFTLNIGLLRAVLTVIAAAPELWRQDVYSTLLGWERAEGSYHSCQTAYCVAGWTTFVAGAPTVRRADGWPTEMATWHDEPFAMPELAPRLLGITPIEADYLFYYDNSAIDVWRVATEIADRAGVALGVPLPAWATP